MRREIFILMITLLVIGLFLSLYLANLKLFLGVLFGEMLVSFFRRKYLGMNPFQALNPLFMFTKQHHQERKLMYTAP